MTVGPDDPDERWMVVDERCWDIVVVDTRVLADRRLDAVEIVVYLALAFHAGGRDHEGNRQAWPSVHTLAAYARVRPTRTRQALERLVKAGYVEQRKRDGKSAVWVLLDLRPGKGGPAPSFPSPWTPPDPGGVERSGPRANSEGLGGRESGSDGPQARENPRATDVHTPPDSGGVVIHTPPDSGGHPSRSWRGTNPQERALPPLPPAGFDAHRRRRGRQSGVVSPGQGLSRDNQRPDFGPRIAAAHERARTLGRNLAGVIAAGDMSIDDLAHRVRRDCCRPVTDLGATFDIEAVTESAIDAAIEACPALAAHLNPPTQE